MTLLAAALALVIIAPGATDGLTLPTNKDITWTESGGLRIDGWLVIEEDYGTDKPLSNEILLRESNRIEYRNKLVHIRKQWKLDNGCLVVEQQIKPLSESARRSKLILHVTSLRKFSQFYTPYAFTAPKISGRWIPAGEMPTVQVPRGAYSNAMLYTLLYSSGGSVMLDRVMTNDYLAWEGGISEASGDFSRIIWPMLAFGHWSWNLGHPGPTGKRQAWLDNLYPREGGSLEYRVHFFKNMSPAELGKQAYGIYLRTRKQVALDKQIYKGWEKAHRDPQGKIAFYAFVGFSWSQANIPGQGGARKDGLIKAAPYYLENLKRMRAILDENGLADAYIYLWIQGYDGHDAGWGQFPLDVKPVKDFFAQVRSAIHHVRLGLYVNFWICPVDAPVYKQHPDWFTKQFHFTDAGTEAYAGKLPQWGEYLASQMPALIKAYGLDFIFFDGADWAPRWRGTHRQCQQFFAGISDVLHRNGAEFWANGNVPFVDVGMDEHVAGESLDSDRDLAANFENISFHKQMMGPMFSWRSWKPVLFFRSGQSILKYFADKPQFLIRWPIHYRDEDMDYILEHFFTPYVKRRAALLK